MYWYLNLRGRANAVKNRPTTAVIFLLAFRPSVQGAVVRWRISLLNIGNKMQTVRKLDKYKCPRVKDTREYMSPAPFLASGGYSSNWN